MIRAEGLAFSIGDFRLGPLDLDVAQGEHFVLLGPPGSGKSLFLECLCGLKRVDSGRVVINNRDVTDLTPRSRGIGYVPQDYALFPHLDAGRNIGFGLRVRGEGEGRVAERIGAAAEKLAISHLLDRSVRGLSGGEKQRVALARALVMDPDVLILDEPVSALDESTRQAVCSEIRRIQKSSGITTIHVSHNMEEAFELADRSGLLHGGRFMQVGTIGDLLRRPGNEFVARFMCCGNIMNALADRKGPQPDTTAAEVGSIPLIVKGTWEGRIKLVIRPENISLRRRDPDRGLAANEVCVRPVRASDHGSHMRVELAGALDLVAHLPLSRFSEIEAAMNEDLVASLPCGQIHVFEETEE